MVRPPCCDKPNVKKGFWAPEEDAKILEHGKGNWTSFPKRAGVRRCGKSCRLRWTNHLRPDLQDESFTPQEEELIIKLHATIGSRWALIAQQLPGKTDNDVKNYWNTKLRKKLSGMGIDPVTHKPFSQILADYGNIGGLPKTGMRIGSLNKDLKNAIFMKREALNSAPTISKPQLTILSPTNNMVSPKTEPNQDNFLNHNKSSSLDLLAQLQAIKLVTETSNYPQPSSYKESTFSFSLSSSSSPSSSSSTDSSAVQETMSPAPAFNWNDFLLEDAFLPPSHGAQEDHDHEKAAQDFSYQKVEGPNNKDSEVNETSSCESSFVEALLARENEMLLDFPQLLEEGFY